jgi:O-antigen ligase
MIPASDARFGQSDQAASAFPGGGPVSLPLQRADATWDWLLGAVAVYILTAIGRIHQVFPFIELLHPAIIAGAAAVVLYLHDASRVRHAGLLWVPTTKWLVALLFWMVLSMTGALVLGTSFDLVFGNFIKTVLMYGLIAGAVRGGRDIERLAAVYLVAVAVYACVVLMRFDVGEGSDWRLGHLYYYDANDFATLAVTAMPFGLYFAHRGRSGPGRFLAIGALVVLTAAFVYSGSRGGFVALVIVSLFIVFRYTAISFQTRFFAVALIGFALATTATSKYWDEMGTIVSDTDYNYTSESGRVQIWRRGIGYMLQHPIFGVGPNNFGAAEGTLSPMAERQRLGIGVRWNAPHNTYLQIGAELGIPGLVLFAGMIASVFAALRRSRHADDADGVPPQELPDLTQAITAALIGFLVGAFFLSLAYLEILYTLLALATAVEKLDREAHAF